MDKVCIMLSTYNGGKYLNEQLKSIFEQSMVDIVLVVRDDGSSDDTIQILKKWKKNTGRIEIPKELMTKHCESGVGSSFMMLLKYCCNHYPEIEYFGFADQDDVWKLNKVYRGVKSLCGCKNKLALYFTKKTIVDERLKIIRQDVIRFHNSFCDFLSPNDASGCTMLFNRNLCELIVKGNFENTPYMHDSILMNVALCTSAEIIYDDYESMLYRQHQNNAVGANTNKLITLKNIKVLFSKRRHYTYKQSIHFIRYYSSVMPEKIKQRLIYIVNKKSPYCLFKLILIYCKESNRSYTDKIRFIATALLGGL